MNTLQHDIVTLCRRNRDGSFATQTARRKCLKLCAAQLKQLGRKVVHVQFLKPKHICALVQLWQQGNPELGYKPLSTGTIKNRLSHLRWLAEKIGKQNIIPRTNQELGIGKRAYKTNCSRAITLTPQITEKIHSPHVKLSLKLQAAFGLRRAEAMLLQPTLADQGSQLFLKSTWCKGGRERMIPIRTAEQRQLLDQAKHLSNGHSLIPPQQSYRQHLYTWEYETQKAGISKTHGLRHCYAQTRYQELTGWKAPAAGGPLHVALSEQEQHKDQQARMQLTEELGHGRLDITNVYLGR